MTRSHPSMYTHTCACVAYYHWSSDGHFVIRKLIDLREQGLTRDVDYRTNVCCASRWFTWPLLYLRCLKPLRSEKNVWQATAGARVALNEGVSHFFHYSCNVDNKLEGRLFSNSACFHCQCHSTFNGCSISKFQVGRVYEEGRRQLIFLQGQHSVDCSKLIGAFNEREKNVLTR